MMLGKTVRTTFPDDLSLQMAQKHFPGKIVEQERYVSKGLQSENPTMDDLMCWEQNPFINPSNNDEFDLVKTDAELSSSQSGNKVCSLEMNGQMSLEKPSKIELICTDIIDRDFVVDLKRKPEVYHKVVSMQESQIKADLEFFDEDQSETSCHITDDDIAFPDKKAIQQDHKHDIISLQGNSEDSKTEIGKMDVDSTPVLSVKHSYSRENSSYNDASLAHSNDFLSYRKDFGTHDVSLIARDKMFLSKVCPTITSTFPSEAYSAVPRIDPSMISQRKGNAKIGTINLSDIMAARTKGYLKDTDIRFLSVKGPNTKHPTISCKETNKFPMKLVEPSGLGGPSTLGFGFGIQSPCPDPVNLATKSTLSKYSQTNQTVMLNRSHARYQSVESSDMFTINDLMNSCKDNNLFAGDLHKQNKGGTTSKLCADAEIALPGTSQDLTFDRQAKSSDTSLTNMAPVLENAHSSTGNQTIFSLQTPSTSHSTDQPDTVKNKLKNKLKDKEIQRLQALRFQPYDPHYQQRLPNLPQFKMKVQDSNSSPHESS